MANVRPADYPSPEQADFTPEETILASKSQPVLNASNWIEARPLPVVNQNWNTSDGFFYRTNAAFARNTRWRIPGLGLRTVVRCVIYAQHPVGGGGAEFKFWSVNAAAFSGTVAVPAGAAAARYEVNLTCSFPSGYDEIQIHTHGDGVNPIRVHSVHVLFPLLSSPLAAPAAANPVTPFDENQAAADEPLDADIARSLRANLAEFLERVRVHVSWSGLANVDSGALASLGMPEYIRDSIALTLTGRMRRGLSGKVHVYAANTSGGLDDQYLYLYGSSPDAGHVETVPAAAADAWYDWDRRMDENDFAGAGEFRSKFELLTLQPHTTDALGRSTAQIQSVSCWSV